MLLLCGGPNARVGSLHQLFSADGMACANYDTQNGPLGDLADTYIFDKVEADVRAGDYAAAIA